MLVIWDTIWVSQLNPVRTLTPYVFKIHFIIIIIIFIFLCWLCNWLLQLLSQHVKIKNWIELLLSLLLF
jgi:hypothetical protein